jgi:hypothetical protein
MVMVTVLLKLVEFPSTIGVEICLKYLISCSPTYKAIIEMSKPDNSALHESILWLLFLCFYILGY